MRAVSCLVILALFVSSRAAFTVVTCTGTQATGNGDKCTDAASTPASTILTCKTGFNVVKAADSTISCVATPTTGTGCTLLAPYALDANNAKTPNGLCAASQPAAAPTSTAEAYVLPTVAAGANTCSPTTNTDVTKTAYTPGAVSTAAGAPFSATPLNTYMCLACPTGCLDCTPATGKGPSPAAATQTSCKTAGNGYYLGTTQDATSGNYNLVSCPAISATFGGNASSCTACNSATNCTRGVCPDPTTQAYLSYANITGVTAAQGLPSNVDLSKLDMTKVPANLQGCYKIADLTSFYGASTKSASRMAISALIVAIAAVFAF